MSLDTTTPEGLRDYAIMLLAFDTGLRSVDIRKLCLKDINWKKGLLKATGKVRLSCFSKGFQHSNNPMLKPSVFITDGLIADLFINPCFIFSDGRKYRYRHFIPNADIFLMPIFS